MSKKTDKVISSAKGVQVVEAIAKKGIATFTQYEGFAALKENETEAEICRSFNRMERVDAINDVNRETPTPSPVRKLTKLVKVADEATQKAIEVATLKIIADAEARIAEQAKANK